MTDKQPEEIPPSWEQLYREMQKSYLELLGIHNELIRIHYDLRHMHDSFREAAGLEPAFNDNDTKGRQTLQ